MNSLMKRIGALERELGTGAGAMLWIDHVDGGISLDGQHYADADALASALGLQGRHMLIGWEEKQRAEGKTMIKVGFVEPGNGRDSRIGG